MKLISLDIHHVRNIHHLKLALSEKINLIQGSNGAGKSSILEAIHHLSTGHSFRSRFIKKVVRDNDDFLSVRGELSSLSTLAIQKHLTKSSVVKINDDIVNSASELARFLPMQIIFEGLFDILNSGSVVRRKFLDWGMFHVEPSFHLFHISYKKALTQKNSLLKNERLDLHSCLAFENAMVDYGLKLHVLREKYYNLLIPEFKKITDILCPHLDITIKYFHGWGQSLSEFTKDNLLHIFHETRERDHQLGHCGKGAHRADLRFHFESGLAKEKLSRGQQKVILIALMLAQGRLLSEDCLYLIDDLCAELDSATIKLICEHFKQSNSQVIITSLDTTAGIVENYADKIFTIQNGILSS